MRDRQLLTYWSCSSGARYPADSCNEKDPLELGIFSILEEAVGFEPTVAINYDSFQDCSVRPLRHASVFSSLSDLAAEQNAFEASKHSGHTVILNRGGHGGGSSMNLFGALTHSKG